jgi:SAM-dependent methyltransferase
LICPACHSSLEAIEGALSCSDCGCTYPAHISGEAAVYDFLRLNENICTCYEDGKTQDRVDLGKLIELCSHDIGLVKEVERSLIGPIIEKEIGTGNLILDLGCARGKYGPLLSRENTSFGLDNCAKRLFHLKPDGSISKDSAVFKGYKAILIGDATNIPIADGSMDMVLSTEVIEHIVEVRSYMKEINRITKMNGKLIISTPNLACYGNRFGMLFGKGMKFHPFGPFTGEGFFPSFEWRNRKVEFGAIRYPEQPLHYRFFTFESIGSFLKEFGFTVRHQYGLDARFAESMNPFISFRTIMEDMVIVAEKVSEFKESPIETGDWPMDIPGQ